MRIAIVGSGIAGLGAAFLLGRQADVTVFEAAPQPGGHAHTVTVRHRATGGEIAVDTGFIVFNRASYPNLSALFDRLAVPVRPSPMSFGFTQAGGRFEYASGAVFAQRSNLVSPAYWRMLADILRFQRAAPSCLARPVMPLAALLDEGGYGRAFVDRHLLAMAAAIWSCPPAEMLDLPAQTFVRFCLNHGLLQLRGRPQWWTVEGGSRAYVDRLLATSRVALRLATPVARVRRRPDGVHLRTAAGHERFDAVILATHADDTLALLAEPTVEERAVLGAIRYRQNAVVLHDDPDLMPRRRRAWSSWNAVGGTGGGVSVTYWMNRLQDIRPDAPLFVSLNPLAEPPPDAIYGRFVYDHPVFDGAAVAAQRRVGAIQGRGGIWYCGAWCGYGFHEDGLASGIAVAEALTGRPRPWSIAAEVSNAWANATPHPALAPVTALAAE